MHMSLSKEQVTHLQKYASLQPASDAALLWFFVWVIVTCGLFWLFSGQAFPKYGDAQGVSLSWVGALITAGGLIATGPCYMLYKYLLVRKKAAVQELRVFISERTSKDI